MSEYYQTTQGTTQSQLANIIAQGTSNITNYYNIQYVPAKDSGFETQSSDTGYKYIQGVSTVDVTSTGTVYYRDITSTTKINSISQYNKCSIVACSGGGGGGGGGGAGFEGDQVASLKANGNYKAGADGAAGGDGIVAVYTGIELTPYSYVTVTINSAGGGGAGGDAVRSGYNEGQSKSYNGQDGEAGQDGSYVKLTGTKSTGTSINLLTVNGGNGGNAGNGGKGNGDGTAGTAGNNGTITVSTGTASSTTAFASSLKVYTNSAQYQSTVYGTNGNGGNDGQSGSKGNDGNSGNGAFARIYFYK